MICYRFVDAEKVNHSVATLCRVIDVSRSGYYAWKDRAPSAHLHEDTDLTVRIRSIFQDSRQTYGAPRIHADLAAAGIHVARKRVARLMLTADPGASPGRSESTSVLVITPSTELIKLAVVAVTGAVDAWGFGRTAPKGSP